MSSDRLEEFEDDDVTTEVPSGLASNSSRRSRHRFGIAPMLGISVLLHGVALAALATCYAGWFRPPVVAVEGGTGSAVGNALDIPDNSLPAQAVALPAEESASPIVFQPPKQLPPDAGDESPDVGALGGFAFTQSSEVIGGSRTARIGLAAAPLAIPQKGKTAAAAPTSSPPAATNIGGNGDGVPVGPPTPYPGNRPPTYPREALLKRIEGTVRIEVEVLPSGEAGDVRVGTSSGHRILDDAAVQAVRRWRFRAAEDASGRPVAHACTATVPIKFYLK